MGEYTVGRKGSDSRCCTPGNVAMTWHDYSDDSHPSILAFEEWILTLKQPFRNRELGEIDALFEMAALGLLQDTEDDRTPIKPVHPDPEVFELRKKVLSKALRFYHGEPGEFPMHLVNLHMHIKLDQPTQDQEIAFAIKRYDDGEPDNWGIAD